MAIEKMVMMNLVGALGDEDPILRKIILMGNVHVQTNLNSIYESRFAFHALEEELSEMENDKQGNLSDSNDQEYLDLSDQIQYISKALGIKPKIDMGYYDPSLSFELCKTNVGSIYSKVSSVYESIKQKEKLIKTYLNFRESIKYILNQDIDFDKLKNLHYFRYKIGMISREYEKKITKNYENITAIVKVIGIGENSKVFLVIYPQGFEIETERILKSANFEEIYIPEDLSGTPIEMNEKMGKLLEKERSNLDSLVTELNEMKNTYHDSIYKIMTKLKMREKVNKVKESVERGRNVFIISGWIPEKEKEEINRQISTVSDHFITTFKDPDETGKSAIPPTKLKNPKWFTPFENLVKMYGVPSYSELDPTMFLSITYLIMFGAMFGDVGQGLIFMIVGSILTKKNKESFFGPIIGKLGISAIVFGFLYGSIFGDEETIPHMIKNIFGQDSLISKLIINPMENMNLILIAAVVFGILLILFGFGYSIINSLRQEDIKEGLFGRNGLAGLIFYISLLFIVYDIVMSTSLIPRTVLIILMIITMILMVVREPLANMIQHKYPLYEDEVAGYYVESGFDIVETILSLASNTISFIRIGAFALNHVGLFMAFKTMASMANGGVTGVLIMILGNIVIIGLEGLIVFIQGLRLQYYELFGKYFRGEGIEFQPVKFID